jgi:hypothetical protein
MHIPLPSPYGGANTIRVDLCGFTFWWSYEVLVAFRVPEHPMVVHENIWTKTTGKHLNLIDGNRPNERVDAETFERLKLKLVKPYFRE